MSVFISWAGADREVKNVIAEKLREAQIEYFDSDEFCQSDFSRECIEKIRLSRVFIVIISDASMSPRSYVFNEVVEARRLEGEGQLNILVYKVTDSPYTERFAFNLNHISDANHVARMQTPLGTSGIDTLVKRTKDLLARRLAGNPEKPCDVQVPKPAGIALSQTKFFVDGSRDGILAEIDDAFSRSPVVILSEIFGFGKRSVIKKYVQLHPTYSAVEIQGMHDSLFRFFLADLYFTNINESIFAQTDERAVILKKFEFLRKLGPQDMLVISDVNLDGEADEFLCSLLAGLRCRVVLITQSSASDYAEFFPVIKVGKMQNEHLFELFFHHYKHANEQEKDLLLPHLEQFFEDVGGHTKAVELTASVLNREMRATPGEVISHLRAGSSDNRTLEDKMLDVFSDLLSLGSFSEDERRALLLISLLANPVMEEKLLFSLMQECEIFDRSVIAALDDRRWITYDARAKSVCVEPIIAKLAVKNFATEEQDVCFACLEHFEYAFISKEFHFLCEAEQGPFYARIENFFRLLSFDDLADVVRICRDQITKHFEDFEQMLEARERFLSHYQDALAVEDEDAPVSLEIEAARWVKGAFVTALRVAELTPMLYSFAERGAVSLSEIQEMLIDEDLEAQINEVLGDGAFSQTFAALDACRDAEDVGYVCVLLCVSVTHAFYKRDFGTLQSRLDELLDFLQSSPQVLEDAQLCGLFFTILKLLHGAHRLSNTVGMSATLYERLLLIDWPADIKLRLLLTYCESLLDMGGEELALSVTEAAEEIFEEAMEARAATETERLSSQKELALLRATALARLGEIDGACEAYEECRRLCADVPCTEALAELINLIADRLIAEDLGRGVAFITENRDLIAQYAEAPVADTAQENCRALLLLQEMYDRRETGGFSAGGIYTDEGYYQRYSKDKKNNLFAMMSYDRIATRAARYDFSGCTNEELRERSQELFRRAAARENRANILPEAFALVSEAGYRVLGYRHHKVQYVGAAAMLDGKIAEILNGEGKTYTITLVAYVNSLYHQKVLVLDSSKYLTQRNYKWMKGVYELLGICVGYLPSREERAMLAADSPTQIIYADIATLGFSVLFNEYQADEARWDLSKYSAIVDEADGVLIESADLPIQITGTVKNNTARANEYLAAFHLAESIHGDTQYCYFNQYGSPCLTHEVRPLIENAFDVSYEDFATANRIRSLEETLRQALYALSLVQGKDFFVRRGRIYRENAKTGSLYEVGARMGLFLALSQQIDPKYYWSAIAKKPTVHNMTHVYSLLGRFGSLCGTSATVCSFKKEFKDIYGLEVVAIPTVLPIRRQDRTVGLYVTRQDKNEDILAMIGEKHATGQPILLIVENIEESAEFSRLLSARGIAHTVINGLNAEKSPEIFANAGKYGSVVIATQLANRGIDIKLGGDAERMTVFSLVESGIDIRDLDKIVYCLPTEEIKAGALYRSYTAALEKSKAIVAADRERVVAAGGLCVISTTAYLDMRIEQQIRGRAGRQGDVGESYVYMSMDDSFIRETLRKFRESGFFQNMMDGVTVLDAPFLQRRIEAMKATVHHRTFARMKSAAVLSGRVDRSKEELFRLRYGLLDGTVSFDELLSIFSASEENKQSALSLTADSTVTATPAVLCLQTYAPHCFTGITPKNAKDKLLAVARLYLAACGSDEEEKRGLFFEEAERALSRHLTEMSEAEETYSAVDIKNGEKFFADLYAKNFATHLSEAIGRWLTRLAPPKEEEAPDAPHTPDAPK